MKSHLFKILLSIICTVSIAKEEKSIRSLYTNGVQVEGLLTGAEKLQQLNFEQLPKIFQLAHELSYVLRNPYHTDFQRNGTEIRTLNPKEVDQLPVLRSAVDKWFKEYADQSDLESLRVFEIKTSIGKKQKTFYAMGLTLYDNSPVFDYRNHYGFKRQKEFEDYVSMIFEIKKNKPIVLAEGSFWPYKSEFMWAATSDCAEYLK